MPNVTDSSADLDADLLPATHISQIAFTVEGLTSLLNHTKDALLIRISRDTGMPLDHNRYIVLVHKRGMLGRFWEKLCGKHGPGLSVDIVAVDTEDGGSAK